jgi:hypothetical protein
MNIIGANQRSAKWAARNKMTAHTGIINPYSVARERNPACTLFLRELREKNGEKKEKKTMKKGNRPIYGMLLLVGSGC